MQKGYHRQEDGHDPDLSTRTAKSCPVTVVEAGPCAVVQKKTVENDGYVAVQLGLRRHFGQEGFETRQGPL